MRHAANGPVPFGTAHIRRIRLAQVVLPGRRLPAASPEGAGQVPRRGRGRGAEPLERRDAGGEKAPRGRRRGVRRARARRPLSCAPQVRALSLEASAKLIVCLLLFRARLPTTTTVARLFMSMNYKLPLHRLLIFQTSLIFKTQAKVVDRLRVQRQSIPVAPRRVDQRLQNSPVRHDRNVRLRPRPHKT